nr:bifunctional oligoribonuclease/PAP phosphatase NrnA [Maliibacterium massiliense]
MFAAICRILRSARKVAVVCHVSPDGDTLGSALALQLALFSLQKKAEVIVPSPASYAIDFLPGFAHTITPAQMAPDYDCVVCVDCTDPERLGDAAPLLARGVHTINIDHHISNTGYAQYNHVEDDASATGEIMLPLLEALGVTLTDDMARCLYVAICTDTGGFAFANTTSRTHLAVAKLMAFDLHVEALHQRLFRDRSLAKTRLLGEVLTHMQAADGHAILWACITREMFEKCGATDADCEGMIDYLRDVQGVDMAAVLRENGAGNIKVSLRAATAYDVNAVAQAFGGGGHKLAAGCQIEGPIDAACARLVAEMQRARAQGA